jgi:hypothetical protein
MSFILALSSGYLMYKMFADKHDTPFIHDIIQKAHKYSGVDPELFNKFLENIKLSIEKINDPLISSKKLYDALDYLEDIALYNNYDIHEEIREIIIELAFEVEKRILEKSLELNKPFNPRYLNDRIY